VIIKDSTMKTGKQGL